jgi:hypothetical protein
MKMDEMTIYKKIIEAEGLDIYIHSYYDVYDKEEMLVSWEITEMTTESLFI